MTEETSVDETKPEPEAPTMTERAHALVAHIEHAAHHNAPIGNAALAELRALLGVD